MSVRDSQPGGEATQVAKPPMAPATVRVAEEALFDTTGSRQASAPPADAAFPEIPGYEILAELGRGGMGVVYKARHDRLGRVVALKMLRESTFASAIERQRFLAEAGTLAKLRHPHIVQIYDFGEHAGAAFFTLEYLDGGSLDQSTRGKPQPQPAAARLVAHLARAVQAAHDQGIVHRDLKPANVLMEAPAQHGPGAAPSPGAASQAPADDLGNPKITDFGIAKHANSELTATQALLGTPSYMSPEQAKGLTREIGPATDIHALGAILYEMLVGNPPFRGTTILETLEQVRLREPVPPRRLQPKVSRDLETICLKCLEKDPRRRYARAADVADDLSRWLRGEPIVARPVGTLELALKWARRRPTAAALLVVSLLAVMGLVATGVGLAYNARLAASLKQTESARREAEAQTQRASSALALAETYSGFHRLALAEQAWQESNLLRLRALLELVPPPQRGWEWRLLDRRTHLERHRLVGHSGSADRVQFSPDGRWLASVSLLDREVRLWDAATGELMHRWSGILSADHHSFSPDGRQLLLVSTRPGWVQCVDVDRGGVLRDIHLGEIGTDGIAWLPDGSGWLTTEGTGEAVVLDPSSGQPLRKLPGLKSKVFRDVDRMGRTIAVATLAHRKVLRVSRYPQATVVAELALPAAALWSLALDPEGRRVAASFDDQTVHVWDVPTQRKLTVFHGHAGNVYGIHFSPDGRWIASASRDRTVKVWQAATGKVLATFRGHTASVHAVAFHPTRPILASCGRDREVRLWDLTRDPEAIAWQVFQKSSFGVAMHPAGTEVATMAFDGSASGFSLTSVTSPRVAWQAACPFPTMPSFSDALQFINLPTGAYLQGVAYSPTGPWVARVLPPPHVVQLMDPERQTDRKVRGQGQMTWAVVFSPDGTRFATGTQEGHVELWEVASGKMVARSPSHGAPVVGLAFTPDGSTLLSTSRNLAVHLHDPATLAVRGMLVGHTDSVFHVAVSGDGQWAATAGKDQVVLLWDLPERRLVHRLVGHAGPVLGVAFAPDGTRLASCGGDHAVKLWDVATGQETLSLRGHNDYVTSVAWSPDGQRLATGGLDGQLRVWDAGESSAVAWQTQRRQSLDGVAEAAWHRLQARLAADEGLPTAAVWHHVRGDWRWGLLWSLLRP